MKNAYYQEIRCFSGIRESTDDPLVSFNTARASESIETMISLY